MTGAVYDVVDLAGFVSSPQGDGRLALVTVFKPSLLPAEPLLSIGQQSRFSHWF
jgi:hypothetical protein